jgi:hypothetical protein
MQKCDRHPPLELTHTQVSGESSRAALAGPPCPEAPVRPVALPATV